MTEAEGLLGEAAEDVVGVAQTAVSGGEAIYQGATGNWDGAADSAQTMSEHALGVATFGASELITEAPGVHEAIHSGLQSAGNATGDAMFNLVGDEHALASANDFDDGHYLAGVGEMAEGAAHTIGAAASHEASAVADEASHLASEAWDGLTDAL